MHLERVLIVVEQRSRPDGSYTSFDLYNTEGPLKCSGLVDNVEVFYYSDYSPYCDKALIDYCLREKPQVVFLCLQHMDVREGGLTPAGARRITHEMGIPTVMVWFSIYSDPIVNLLEQYIDAVSLHLIIGADESSHRPIPFKGVNYVYAGNIYDERLFSIPEGERDIPVGLLGSLVPFRLQWINGLKELGVPVYTGGGTLVEGGDTSNSTGQVPPLWMPYEEYLRITSRLKIVLNVSTGMGPKHLPLDSTIGQAERSFGRLASEVKGGLSSLINNPGKIKYIFPALKNIASTTVTPPKLMTRGRVFEALWSRTFLLEEENPITSRYFEPYVDYVPFSTL
ncbi:hypothetical protein ACFLYN_04810, partial [Chloroflexota bacterium]